MRKIHLPIILLLLFVVTVPAETDIPDKKPSVVGIALGVGVMAGGSIFSIYNYTRAKSLHNRYEKSAFTDNTMSMHREIKLRDIMCVAGAAVVGLGLVVVVVSF